MSFVKKSYFQTVIFAIIFMAMNGHTYKLFKNIYNYVQTEINMALNNYSINFIEVEGLKIIYSLIYKFHNCILTSKNVK